MKEARDLQALATALLSFLSTCAGWGATTINSTHHCGYGANVGWVNCRGDVASGAQIGRYYCAGYLYSANAGWINLGGGNPANGYAYQNDSAADFGVNTDIAGNLRGYAWAANLGWINFETNGAAKVSLQTGALGGYAYSANCGWISLSNGFARVMTDSLWPGQTEASGLPLAWQVLNFGQTGVSADADADHDGTSNLAEYLAGTDPNDGADVLRITSAGVSSTSASLTWNSTLSRQYIIEEAGNLSGGWSASSLGLIAPDGASTTRTLLEPGSAPRFYRIKAIMPPGQ